VADGTNGADLFDAAAEDLIPGPLAARMRPRMVDEVVGQDHLLHPGSPLRRLVDVTRPVPDNGAEAPGQGPAEGSGPVSVILWGPPGTGKTTLASLISRSTGRRFVELSAVTAGVKDLRAVIDDARRTLVTNGPETVLFVDEVHRFSKTQQDALLPAVENRWVVLVAATTENPHFSVISPLLSRSLVLTLRPLDDEAVRCVVERSITSPRGLAGAFDVTPDAVDQIVRLAGGDARRGLTALEAAAGVAGDRGDARITLEAVELAVDRAAVRYDRDGDQHYDVASALIKSLRGSDVDAAIHYLARMVEAGEDPRFIARRLVIFASEDVGMADPTALQIAVAALQAAQFVGLPEARLNLAQAVIHLSLAPKSNAVIVAIDEALADLRRGVIGTVPAHLRDAHYPGARDLGHGGGYRYPHDDPRGVVAQQYAPDPVLRRTYYRPTAHGAERAVAERAEKLRDIVRGTTDAELPHDDA
jgi:putative ATPase